MKKSNKNQGITLISLIITIIVMLILVGVSISIAVNGGLFNYAGKVAKEMQNAMDQEQQLINDIIDKYFKEKNDENEPEEEIKIPEELKAGDYVNYTPSDGIYTVASGEYGSGYTENQTFTTDSTLKWRVWSIDEEKGTVELISDKATHTLYLQSANGYNHGVDILNDLCEKLYSNKAGTIARSINVEDINAKTTYDYTDEICATSDGFSVKYGEKKQLSTYTTTKMIYPNICNQEKSFGLAGVFNQTLEESKGLNDGVTDESGTTTYRTVTGYTDGNIAGTDPHVTHSLYGYDGKQQTYYPDQCLKTNLGVNSVPVGLINTEQSYWMASRGIYVWSGGANFDMRVMFADGFADGRVLINSSYYENDPGFAVRPIVSLNPSATFTKDETNSTESVTYWNIEY